MKWVRPTTEASGCTNIYFVGNQRFRNRILNPLPSTTLKQRYPFADGPHTCAKGLSSICTMRSSRVITLALVQRRMNLRSGGGQLVFTDRPLRLVMCWMSWPGAMPPYGRLPMYNSHITTPNEYTFVNEGDESVRSGEECNQDE